MAAADGSELVRAAIEIPCQNQLTLQVVKIRRSMAVTPMMMTILMIAAQLRVLEVFEGEAEVDRLGELGICLREAEVVEEAAPGVGAGTGEGQIGGEVDRELEEYPPLLEWES